MRVVAVKVDGVIFAVVFLVVAVFGYSQGGTSEDRLVVTLFGAVGFLAAILTSFTLLSDEGVIFLNPFKRRIRVKEIDSVGTVLALSKTYIRQLSLVVNGNEHRVSNVTSRHLQDQFLHDLRRELEVRWLDGGPAPTRRWWLVPPTVMPPVGLADGEVGAGATSTASLCR